MTLGELKRNTLQVLEEQSNSLAMTDDEDINKKLIIGINTVMSEMAKVRGISRSFEFEQHQVSKMVLPMDAYEVTDVQVDGKSFPYWSEKNGAVEVVATNKKISVFYDAQAPIYTKETPNETILPFDNSACLIMPFGIAKIILMTTGQTNDAMECETKYYQLLQEQKVTAGKTKLRVTNIFGRWAI